MKFLKLEIDNNRNFGLDIVRAIAIMNVLFLHSQNFLYRSIVKYTNFFLYDGVGIFFVLSGFLIGGIIIKQYEKKFGYKEIIKFWINRWSRTLPNYYLFLFLTIILHLYIGNNFVLDVFPKYLLFLQNLIKIPEFYGNSWSLAVEEWFYMCLPIFLLRCEDNYLSLNKKDGNI